ARHDSAPRVRDRGNPTCGGAGNGARPPPPALVRRLRELVPPAVQNWVARMVPVHVRDAVVNRAIVAGHDWPHTPGFDVLADLNAYLRLNVKGRERDGALEPGSEELARYRGWIRRCFEGLRIEASGAPLVGELHDVFP